MRTIYARMYYTNAQLHKQAKNNNIFGLGRAAPLLMANKFI